MKASPPHIGGDGATALTSMGSTTESSTTTPRPARPMTSSTTNNAIDPEDTLEQDFAKAMDALIAKKGVDGARQSANYLLLLASQSSNSNNGNTPQPQPNNNNSQITTLASEPTGVLPSTTQPRQEPQPQPPPSQPQAQPEEQSHEAAEGSLALHSTSQPTSTTAPNLPPLNGVDLCGECGETTADDVATNPQAPSMAQPNDGDYLSEKSTFARLHFFVLFIATEEDCAKKVKGRIHKPIVGQVGLRCACCDTDLYAKGVEHMKSAADTLLRRHLMKCSSIPDELKVEFQGLKQNKPKGTGMTVPNYWIHCLVESGVYEEEGRLLYNAPSEVNQLGNSLHNDDVYIGEINDDIDSEDDGEPILKGIELDVRDFNWNDVPPTPVRGSTFGQNREGGNNNEEAVPEGNEENQDGDNADDLGAPGGTECLFDGDSPSLNEQGIGAESNTVAPATAETRTGDTAQQSDIMVAIDAPGATSNEVAREESSAPVQTVMGGDDQESPMDEEVANASIAAITSPLQSVKAGKEVDKEQEHSIAAALLSLKQNNELQEEGEEGKNNENTAVDRDSESEKHTLKEGETQGGGAPFDGKSIPEDTDKSSRGNAIHEDGLQTEGDSTAREEPAIDNAEKATEAEQIEQHVARSSGMAEQIEQNVAGSSGIAASEQDKMNEPRITNGRPEDEVACSSSENCKATEKGGSNKTKADQAEQGSSSLSEQLEQDQVAKEHTNSLEQESDSWALDATGRSNTENIKAQEQKQSVSKQANLIEPFDSHQQYHEEEGSGDLSENVENSKVAVDNEEDQNPEEATLGKATEEDEQRRDDSVATSEAAKVPRNVDDEGECMISPEKDTNGRIAAVTPPTEPPAESMSQTPMQDHLLQQFECGNDQHCKSPQKITQDDDEPVDDDVDPADEVSFGDTTKEASSRTEDICDESEEWKEKSIETKQATILRKRGCTNPDLPSPKRSRQDNVDTPDDTKQFCPNDPKHDLSLNTSLGTSATADEASTLDSTEAINTASSSTPAETSQPREASFCVDSQATKTPTVAADTGTAACSDDISAAMVKALASSSGRNTTAAKQLAADINIVSSSKDSSVASHDEASMMDSKRGNQPASSADKALMPKKKRTRTTSIGHTNQTAKKSKGNIKGKSEGNKSNSPETELAECADVEGFAKSNSESQTSCSNEASHESQQDTHDGQKKTSVGDPGASVNESADSLSKRNNNQTKSSSSTAASLGSEHDSSDEESRSESNAPAPAGEVADQESNDGGESTEPPPKENTESQPSSPTAASPDSHDDSTNNSSNSDANDITNCDEASNEKSNDDIANPTDSEVLDIVDSLFKEGTMTTLPEANRRVAKRYGSVKCREMKTLIRSRLCELLKDTFEACSISSIREDESCCGIWDDMTVAQLRKECKVCGLRVRDEKAKLLKRLNDWWSADDSESLLSSTASSLKSQQDSSDEESEPSVLEFVDSGAKGMDDLYPFCYQGHLSPPDKHPAIKDKLECCQMVLHANFNKNQLSKSAAKSVVSSKEEDIKDFMTKSIETGMSADGMTIPSPGFMYICGGPGTGKTTAVASCAEEAKKWARQNGYERPIVVKMNMTKPSGDKGIMRTMLDKMARPLGLEHGASPTEVEKKMKKKVLVLVLDEIDMLFRNHGKAAALWFKTLIGWAEDKELCFSMIGISNCVNDTNSTKIRELGHSPHELVFSAYREGDILAILQQRVGSNVIDLKALQLISRRVAAGSGDARRALEITSNAAGKCADMMSAKKLETEVEPDDECMPLVKLPHVMRAIKEGMPMRHGEVIVGLPQAAKVILCICVSLGQVWGPTAEINIPTLKKYCVEATQHAIMDELGLGHIMNLAEMLIDAGLLVTGNSGGFNPQNPNAKLKIGVQLDEVEIALEETLLQEGGFYASLVAYVKRECPRQ